MVDLQFVEMRDVLKVLNVSPVQNSDPYTLHVKGQDFNNTEYVLINDVMSPSVVVVSSTEMLVQVPTDPADPIRSVVAISSRLTRTDRSRMSFRISDTPKSIDGFERLIQAFMKTMLQSPGSDVFAPLVGGGLLASVGKQMRDKHGATVVSDFHAAVTRTKSQLLAIQTNDPSLKMTERLLYAQVADARFIPHELTLIGKVLLGNQAGHSSVVGLGL